MWVLLPTLCKATGIRQRYRPHEFGACWGLKLALSQALLRLSTNASERLGALNAFGKTLAELFSFYISDVSSKREVMYLIVDLSRVCLRALATWLKSPVFFHTVCA